MTINKIIAGEQVSGYPKIYYGIQAFTYNSVSYAVITSTQLATLSVTAYEERLEAFQSYVESQELGLDISEVQTNEPYYTA